MEPPCCVSTVAQDGQTSRDPSAFYAFKRGSMKLKESTEGKMKKKKRKTNKRNQCLLVLVKKFENPDFGKWRIILFI